MKNSKFVFDKFTKLLEQGLVSSRDLKNEIVNILKSKRDEIPQISKNMLRIGNSLHIMIYKSK